MRAILAAAIAVAGLQGALSPAFGAAEPHSVVSLNLCADELVLRLAAPGQVRSVTWLARDSLASTVAAHARDIPVNHGLAEEIVPLSPDLVIAGVHTTRMTVAFLERLGIPVMDLGVPATLEAVRAQIRQVAEALGRDAAGETMIADLDSALAGDGTARESARPTALVLRPNGFTAGRGSLADTLLTRAGLTNLAAELQPEGFGQLALEEIVAAKPDILILNTDPHAPPSMAQSLLEHPALADLKGSALVVSLPIRLWTCAGPQLADAMTILNSAAEQARHATGKPRQAP